VLERGYEGLVAKDPASPYVGGRTLNWLKVKQAKYRVGERGWEPKGERQIIAEGVCPDDDRRSETIQ
jgi:ATP-dependent DNA ligase